MSQTFAFSSINEMLMQNRCWLCEETFQKGKTKKVFQLTDLLEFFVARLTQEHANQEVPALKSKTLRESYECFKALAVFDANGNIDSAKVISELRTHDIETWMSGLICGVNAQCQEELPYFVKDLSAKGGNATKSAPASIISTTSNGQKAFFMPSMDKDKKDCPPGCNCDNPWPFLS
jgi:hypothetical protein